MAAKLAFQMAAELVARSGNQQQHLDQPIPTKLPQFTTQQ
ncbi:hypothetical protein MTO96_038318, partial [Rhipicephalus appendiculatus]